MLSRSRTVQARLVVLALAGALIAMFVANLTPPSQATNASPISRDDDKIADYGVCRGTDPDCYNNWDTAFRRDSTLRILIYSRTGVSRHAHLGPLLGPGLNPPLADANVAQRALVRWAAEKGIQADWTEDVTQLDSPAKLLRYDGVVFLSTSRDILDDAAQTSLTQYMRAGGGFVAIHNTLGTEYNWPYFQELLVGANFYDHGPHRNGVMGHPGHPRNHPLSWCQYYDGGRSWVTSLGHDVNDWGDGPLPGKEFF